MDLDIAIENAAFRLKMAMESISVADPNALDGSAYLVACEENRKLACLNLLATADTNAYTKHLSASVNLWIKFQKTIFKTDACLPLNKCGSYFYPLFDALALGHYDAATEIASDFPATHQAEWEYEDDFLFYKFVCDFLLNKYNKCKTKTIQSTLDRWEEVLDGDSDTYYDTCKSLADSDASGFLECFESLIFEREENFEAWRETTSYQEEGENSNRYVYVNGIGLLKLAQLSNIQVNDTFLSIPELAFGV